jgi:hypothetical protein
MAICANCTTEASVAYRTPGIDIPYCDQHVPSFLSRPDYKSMLHTLTPEATDAAVEPVIEAPKPSFKKKGADPEPVIDEPVIEEASKDVEAEVSE